jgi:hypothetical protein
MVMGAIGCLLIEAEAFPTKVPVFDRVKRAGQVGFACQAFGIFRRKQLAKREACERVAPSQTFHR